MNESTAARYQRARRRVRLAGLLAGAAWLLVLVLTPLSAQLAAWAVRVAGTAAPLVFAAVVASIWEALALAGAIVVTLAGGRRKREGAAAGVARDAVLGFVVVLVSTAVVWFTAQVFDTWWWMVAGVAAVGALLAGSALTAALLRRSAELRPVSKPSLNARLERLTAATGTGPLLIREWIHDDSDLNAAIVAGVGRGSTVVLGRQLVTDWPEDEVAVIVAHELSHVRHRDVWRKTLLDGVVVTVALAVADRVTRAFATPLDAGTVDALSSLPLLAASAWAGWGVLRPIRLAQSRAHERRADRFALEVIDDVGAFSRAIRRMAAERRSEDRPSRMTRWWFHRHPTVEERLKMAATR